MSRTSSTFRPGNDFLSSKKGSGGTDRLGDSRSSLQQSNGLLRHSTGSMSGLAANLHLTGTGTSSSKLGRTSTDLDRIEGEYIKNLQQQVYFLELEANYLREQVKKATELHPHMTTEAERMLAKLRQMQSEVDNLRIEGKRKDSNIDMVSTDKERVISRLKSGEEAHTREKRLLLDEIVQNKKEKDLLDRDNVRKESQILQAREELDKSTSALRGAETKIQMLKNQLEQKTEQHFLSQSSLEEKRTELLKTETQLREIEDKFYSSTANLQDKLVQDLRDEVRMLRQKVKEAEMNSEQDRYLRTKLSDDSSHLVKENALLSQQVTELQKQLEREKSLRESNDTRRSSSISELVMLKDREQQLRYELNQNKEQLSREQQRTKHYMEQLAKQEQASTSTELNASTTYSRLAELEGRHQGTETENSELRRDKMLLVDHVAELQKQLDDKEKEVTRLQNHIMVVEGRLKELEHLKGLESSLHSQKWDEFSRLADSMKSLTRSMTRTASPSRDYA